VHRHKENAKQQELVVLGECAYFTTGCGKTHKYVPEISEKTHFKIRHYIMPPHWETLKNFNTTTFDPVCNGIKS